MKRLRNRRNSPLIVVVNGDPVRIPAMSYIDLDVEEVVLTRKFDRYILGKTLRIENVADAPPAKDTKPESLDPSPVVRAAPGTIEPPGFDPATATVEEPKPKPPVKAAPKKARDPDKPEWLEPPKE